MHFLGKNIRLLRKRTSTTQSRLASLVGKGQTTVGNWENGVSEPSLQELLILSNYFGVSLDQLITRDLSKQSAPYEKPPIPYDHSTSPESMVNEPSETYATDSLQAQFNAIWTEIRHIHAKLDSQEKKQPSPKQPDK